MTQSPPPGWHPDPEGIPGRLRWWDGTQWTSATHSEPTPSSIADAERIDSPPDTGEGLAPPAAPNKKRNNRIALGIIAAVIAALIGIAAIGGSTDEPSSDEAATAASVDEVSDTDARASCDDAVAERFPKAPDPSAYSFVTSRQGDAYVTTGRINSEGPGSGLMLFTCVTKNTAAGLTSEVTSASPAQSDEEMAAARAAAEEKVRASLAAAEAERAALLDPANYETLTARDFALFAKNPDSFTGRKIVLYGVVTQADAATGTDIFRANTASEPMGASYNYDENTIVTAKDESVIADIVKGDFVTMYVEVKGSQSYDTQIGGSTTAPLVQVNVINVTG